MNKRELKQLITPRVGRAASVAPYGSEIVLLTAAELAAYEGNDAERVVDELVEAAPETVKNTWNIKHEAAGDRYRILLRRVWPYQAYRKKQRLGALRKVWAPSRHSTAP